MRLSLIIAAAIAVLSALIIVLFKETVIEMQTGDRLYIHSDGLDEQMTPEGELFGLERLRETIARTQTLSLSQSLDTLVRTVLDWNGSEHLSDDVSLLGLEIQ